MKVKIYLKIKLINGDKKIQKNIQKKNQKKIYIYTYNIIITN